MYELIKNLKFAAQKAIQGQSVVFATIIKTEGSSYRKMWTQMVIAQNLTYEGALSGGCVEREVVRRCNKLFFSKENIIFEYDGTENLGCKGKMWILLEYVEAKTILILEDKIGQDHQNRSAIPQLISYTEDLSTGYSSFYSGEHEVVLSEDSEESQLQFHRKIPPQVQLLIIGGEFDSFILARQAKWTGFATTLVVSKDYKKPDYNPEYNITFALPGQLAEKVTVDEHTAIVLMTHSIKKDMDYLEDILPLDYGYLGVLGPKNRKYDMIARYKEAGKSAYLDKLEEVYGPVGIYIYAKTPEEIGISILSEIIQEFNC